MNSMSKNLSFSAKPLLLVTTLIFNQAYAYSGDCGTLHLLVDESIYQNFELSPGNPAVRRGVYEGCKKKVEGGDDCLDFVFSQFALRYGPDATLEFREKDTNKTAQFRIQQNYCFFEAGNITVEPRNSFFTYNIFMGSKGDDRPGVVVISSIEFP